MVMGRLRDENVSSTVEADQNDGIFKKAVYSWYIQSTLYSKKLIVFVEFGKQHLISENLVHGKIKCKIK
jgi:hypothetical protein